jgi:methyl-accepting chemotaxis protein
VNDVMSHISAASAEQSSGIEQINTAVVQMDQVTQQNAALVEEAAAAAESMQNQAAQLTHVVSSFKTNGAVAQQGGEARVAARARPALSA